MIKELWSSFPRTLEDKINGLLDEAEPSVERAFLIYKSCKAENCWSGDFESFAEKLSLFFKINKSDRRKSHFDKLIERPLSHNIFIYLDLDFRSAEIPASSLHEVSSWAHHLLRVAKKTQSSFISQEVLEKTLQKITKPGFFEKAKNIHFSDFCSAWKKISFHLFGSKYDNELNEIVIELKWHYAQEVLSQKNTPTGNIATLYLTQTEIDWTEEVLKTTLNNQEIPLFPLSRGPQKQKLIELQRTISLYRIVQKSKTSAFARHRDKIKATILHQCRALLSSCSR